MDDFLFSPNRLAWRVGDTVTITVLNRSSSQPGAAHEIMFGRRPLREEGVLGPVQGDGFEEQLLDGATIELLAGDGVTMIMAETSRLTGVDPMSLMPPGMDMGAQAMTRPGMDFMAVVAPRGSLTFRFQVPDRPGDWELGCFAGDGQHYLNGMKGVVTVTSR
jgi:plastocyanin